MREQSIFKQQMRRVIELAKSQEKNMIENNKYS
jgi:hypothetical protein